MRPVKGGAGVQAASSNADDVFAAFYTTVFVLLVLSTFREFCLTIIGVDRGSLLTRGGDVTLPSFEED